MRPIDTAETEREIEQAERGKDELDKGIEHLEELQRELPDLTSKRTVRENVLAERREELEEVEA